MEVPDSQTILSIEWKKGPHCVILGNINIFAKYDHGMGARFESDFVAVQGCEYGKGFGM